MGDGGWGGGAWLIYFHVFQIEGSVNVEGEGGGASTYMINIMYRFGKPTKLFQTKIMLKLLFTKKGSRVA